MKIVFSFCIYGDSKKYCQGLTENLKLIQEFYPETFVHVYHYYDVPKEYLQQYTSFAQVVLKKTNNYFLPNMVDRFFVLDEDPSVDVMIVRDADSRIHDRDRFCIDHFLQSDMLCHTIRDHHLHHSPILGGLWGMKRGALQKNVDMREIYAQYKASVELESPMNKYGHDMFFLRYCIYNLVLPSLIVYTFASYLRIHNDEYLLIIPSTGVKDHNFCGQVLEYDEHGNEIKQYTFPV